MNREPKDTTYVKMAEQIVKEFNGNFPTTVELFKIKGGCYLYKYMKAHPEKFQHIPKYDKNATNKAEIRLKKRLQKYVKIVEKIALNNGGQLPCSLYSLTRVKHLSSIIIHMKKYPEAFAHIPRMEKIPKEKA